MPRTPAASRTAFCRTRLTLLAATIAVLLPASSAPAELAEPWSKAFPAIAADVQQGRPLVVLVWVPLCSNEQIHCGSSSLGQPGSLETNLYWGARFGARRLFDEASRDYERLELRSGGPHELERVVYRRWVRASSWGKPGSSPGSEVEQIVVLQAVHGQHIDHAVDQFWAMATQGGTVRFQDGARNRRERVHVVGYAGHNRLMDGKRLPAAPADAARAIPSFVLACLSQRFFGDALRQAGSTPLVTTRAFMAPEGYVIEGLVRALGDNAPLDQVRERTVRQYAKWQKLSFGAASRLFH